MKELGKRGVWIFPDAPSAREVAAFAQGGGKVWATTRSGIPRGTGLREPELRRLRAVGDGAAVRRERHRQHLCAPTPWAAVSGHDTLNHFYGGPLRAWARRLARCRWWRVFRGATATPSPWRTMRAYLDAMDAAEVAIPAQERNVVLAALGPRMLALAAERTRGRASLQRDAGAHRAGTRDRGGRTPGSASNRRSAASPTRHRRPATWRRKTLGIYMPLTNYRNNWLSLGFGEDELGRAGAATASSMPWSPGASPRPCARGSGSTSMRARATSASSPSIPTAARRPT